jgi:tetratricopeptide (TPR) repeat protein
MPGYEILGPIGRGAMGLVYKARQQGLNRLVALKVMRSPLAGREGRARFRAEAEALGRLDHPNIVQVFDVGEYDGLPYFTMEYVPGGSLDSHMDGTPLSPEPAACLVRTLALAMRAAHDAGIVHRDLKPANILLQGGNGEWGMGHTSTQPVPAVAATSFPIPHSEVPIPKITDFGLAKHLGNASCHTQDGALMGTPSYMAPEQADGLSRDVGPATDVWALGAILYELITGRPPFKGETVGATLEQVRSLDPVAPRQLQPHCGRDLETICLKCLEKDPARRYDSAGALAEDLRRYLAGEPTVARPAGVAGRLVKWGRRHPSQALLAGVVLLAAGAAVAAQRLNIVVLASRVRKAEADARAQQRRATTLADNQELLRAAEKALAGKGPEDWDKAQDYCDQVLQRIPEADAAGDPDLTRLRADAAGLRGQARRKLHEDAQRKQAHKDLEAFFRLHDEAFFLLHRDLVANTEANPRDSQRAAREALRLFGGPDHLPDPAVLPYYNAWQKQQLRTGFVEVLVVLAEAMARAGKPADALKVLEHAGALIPAGYVARCRARYRAQLGEPVPTAAGLSPQTPLDWLLAGYDRLVQAGDARGALHDLNEAIDADPELFWAYFLRAQAWHRLGSPDAARVDLSSCIGWQPDFAWCYLQRGFLAGQAGDFTAAQSDFARAADLLRKHPDPAAHYVLSVNRAVLALTRYRSPRDPASFLSWVGAVVELEQAAALAPRRYHAYLTLSQALLGLRQPARAVARLDEATRLIPGQPELYRERAEARLKCDRPHEALADLDEAARLAAASGRVTDATAPARLAEVHLRRAEVLLDLGQNARAARAGRAGLELNESDAHGHHLLGRALLAQGSYKEALAELDRCLALSRRPGVQLFLDRAQARVGLRQFDALAEEYTRALEVKASPEVYAARGWVRVESGAPSAAGQDFEKAVSLDAECADAQVGLAFVAALSGDHRRAAGEADRALWQERQRGRAPTWRLLYKAVRVFAQAAGTAAASADADTRAYGHLVYVPRAVRLLEETLKAASRTGPADFWRHTVAADTTLAPIKGTPEFGRLASRYGR